MLNKRRHTMRNTVKSLALLLLGGGISLGTTSCAHQPDTTPVVPSSAVQMSTGDKAIAVTVPQDGVIYLRDDSANRVLYSADVKKDQVVRYDPSSRQVVIDDNPVAQSIAGNNHQHSIFFHPSGRAENSAAAADTSSADKPANSDQKPTTQPGGEVPVIHVPLGVKVDVQTQPA
jgi:hypothetical protein